MEKTSKSPKKKLIQIPPIIYSTKKMEIKSFSQHISYETEKHTLGTPNNNIKSHKIKHANHATKNDSRICNGG